MNVLKEVIHDTKTNSVEATWVETITLPQREISPGVYDLVLRTQEVQVKCHSYADVQMGMFRADVLALGGNIAEHEALITAVEAAIIPYVAPPVPNPRISEIKTRLEQTDIESIRALRAKSIGKNKAADDTKLSTLDTEAEALRLELTTTPLSVTG